MATNSPGATGSRERRFRNILGASWELGAWEFIAQRYSLGGHLGNQNHCSVSGKMGATGRTVGSGVERSSAPGHGAALLRGWAGDRKSVV